MKKQKKLSIKIVGLSFLAACFALSAYGSWKTYTILRDLPNPERLTERTIAESTKIFDRTGKILLYEVHGEEKRTIIPFSDIPQSVKDATLAAEDTNFYRHHGLDYKGILRAFGRNIMSGTISQGGSTITQQLVKKSILSDERTYTRKIKEAVLALAVETRYSKDEIFELYLNQIPYGSNAYGISAAAETFFGKEVKDLSFGESALIAALPQAPSYYSPYGTHTNELIKRRDWILERLKSSGQISDEEMEYAKKEQLSFMPPKSSIRAPHFVFYVQEYLNKQYGEEVLEKGGLRVITTIDWRLQEEAEKIIKEGAEKNESLVDAKNASLVAIDPKTGEILTMVGSRDYWGESSPKNCTPGINCKFDPFVNTTTSLRQPGSSFKPFIYATAFKKGYTPNTILFDVETEFNASCNSDGTPGPQIKDPEDCYHPKNYDNKFRGPVTLRQAIAQSLNIPSVKLLYLTGIDDVITTSESMGITTLKDPKRYGLSLVLGGAEVSLLEMTSAFGVFAQDGVLHPKQSIIRIENAKGDILEEKKDSSIPAIDTEVARTMNDVLSDNNARIPAFSPQSSLYFSNRQVAAKTGTTQDYRDAWVIGYTPSLVAGVWVGNNDNTPMNQSAISIMVAGPIWHRFIEFALEGSVPEEFIPPERKTSSKAILNGVYRSGPIVKIDSISKKLATTSTPPELIEEQGFGTIQTILFSIDKSDPTGPTPTNPSRDPQFKNWQDSINTWVVAHNPTPLSPPTEYDDLHTPDSQPKIEFEIITNNGQEMVKVRTTQKFPLREITVFIDDAVVGSKTSPIVSLEHTFPAPALTKNGEHFIKIVAYDSVGNKTITEKSIFFE